MSGTGGRGPSGDISKKDCKGRGQTKLNEGTRLNQPRWHFSEHLKDMFFSCFERKKNYI